MSGPGLALVLHDGAFARLHYALVMASGAAAINRPVTLFFAGDAVAALQKTFTPPEEDDAYQRKGVAGFEELLDACSAFGVTIIACETALAIHGLTESDLNDELELSVGGFITFLNQAGDSQMIFI